jgi:tetratricopeptide (TPR) repeat protein
LNKFFQFNELLAGANEFFKRGKYWVSLEYLERALSLNLNLSKIHLREAYELRGLVRMHLHQYTDAIFDFNKGVDLDPMNASLYFYRQYSFCAISQYKEAIADCKKLIELEPEDESHKTQLIFLVSRTK